MSSCNIEWSNKKERPPQVSNSKSLHMPPVKNVQGLKQQEAPAFGRKRRGSKEREGSK